MSLIENNLVFVCDRSHLPGVILIVLAIKRVALLAEVGVHGKIKSVKTRMFDDLDGCQLTEPVR